MPDDTLAIGPDGRLTRNGDTYDIVFERRFKQPIEKVWAAITVPERIANWFTTMSFEPDLRLGARVTIAFASDDVVRGEVTALDPPRVFAYRELQPGGPHPTLRFELEPDGEGTRLVFSQTGLGGKSRDGMAVNAAGWHEFLDALIDLVAGTKVEHDQAGEPPLSPRYRHVVDRLWETGQSDAEIRRRGDAYELTFVRRLRHPVEKVWAALTVPERIADWLATATIEPDLRIGAKFSLHFGEGDYRMSGEIIELDPPRLIVWTWPDVNGDGSATSSLVRFELEPAGDGCILTLTNGGLGKITPDQAAGWHTHLEGLEGAADGVRTPWSADRERVHAARYRAALAKL